MAFWIMVKVGIDSIPYNCKKDAHTEFGKYWKKKKKELFNLCDVQELKQHRTSIPIPSLISTLTIAGSVSLQLKYYIEKGCDSIAKKLKEDHDIE